MAEGGAARDGGVWEKKGDRGGEWHGARSPENREEGVA